MSKLDFVRVKCNTCKKTFFLYTKNSVGKLFKLIDSPQVICEDKVYCDGNCFWSSVFSKSVVTTDTTISNSFDMDST